MSSRTWTAVTTAAGLLALLALLMFTPVVIDAPPITLCATQAAAGNPVTATTVPHMERAPAERQHLAGYPLRRRRRIHFWNHWTHYGGRGPLGWLFLGPLLAIIIAAVALPFVIRAGRRKKLAQRNVQRTGDGLPGLPGHPPGGPVDGADGGDPVR